MLGLVVGLTAAGCGGGDPAPHAAAPVSTTTSTATAATPPSTADGGPTSTAAAARPSAPTPTTAAKAAASPTTASTGSTTGSGPQPAPHATVFVAAAPTDPAELDRLADQLAADETALRSPATPAADLPALARRQQAAYRALSARPDAMARVLPRLPEWLRPIAQANVDAGAELRAMTRPKTDLPPWRILTPPPPEELERYYHQAEEATHVPWAYLAAVHLVETRMGRIRGTSTAGAQGPMQFLPSTWARWGGGGDINDPHDAIMAAGRYLAASGAPADLHKALYAYNHSEHYVRAVTLYAQQIEANPRAYLAYHAWQVYYITPRGDLWLEEGYGS
ncbi:MAG TPA: transglycosylase SLT domain-containing protein [Acidimicrobiia bacterium]|nr:transglycosylase SLT domain-containing protein [Acidimicrobiia bacterium]